MSRTSGFAFLVLLMLPLIGPSVAATAIAPFAPTEAANPLEYYRHPTPPPGFAAVTGWMQAIDIRGQGEPSTVEVDWMRLHATVNGADVVLLEDLFASPNPAMEWYGLYRRDPWFAGDWLESMPFDLQGGAMILQPGLRPDRVFHWWNTAPAQNVTRALVPAGTSRIWFEARARIAGGAGVQAGIDYWKDLTAPYAGVNVNNTEAGASDWYGNSTGDWQIIQIPSPFFTNRAALIAHYYRSILGRAPDSGGAVYWQDEIARLRGLGADLLEAYRVMAGWFFASDEYAGKNASDVQYVTDLYRAFFGRSPDQAGLNFWIGQLAAGMPRGVALYSFLFSVEFGAHMRGLLGDTTSRGEADAVMDFYRGFLNRLPDSGGFGYWIDRFRAAQCRGAAAVNAEAEAISRQFAASGEYASRRRDNRDYIGDLYYAFLRRGGELAGFEFWVDLLDRNLKTRDQLRRDFLASPEFQARVQRIIDQGCLVQ
jgi:hypothetical protein